MMKKAAGKIISRLTLLVFLSGAAQLGFAQQDSLKNLIQRFDTYNTQNFQEKIFVHTDRTFYLTGETMWFSIYLVDGFFHRPASLSKVVYLEVIDKDNVSVLKTKIPMNDGFGNGSLFLPSSITSGKFTIIAYTRWMRNFSPDVFYQQLITVVNPFKRLDPQPKQESPTYDIQFFPEGGNMVAGLQNTVAFRVVGRNGKGINFKGAILNHKNDTLVKFRPVKFGLGQFSIIPAKGETLTAVIIDSLHQNTLAPLPKSLDVGYTLHLTDTADFINVNVRSNIIDASQKEEVLLFVQSRQIRVFAASQTLVDGATTFRIEKKILHEGVNHISLFNAQLRPVCERSYFVTPHQSLRIDAMPDRESYSTREKINLNLIASAAGGPAVKPALSVSVYRIDSLEQEDPMNISDYFWLTSELKGAVESPGFYLKEAQNPEAIDNLMLTHGWSRFTWSDVLSNKKTQKQFIPEYNGHLLTGTVTNLDGTLKEGIDTYFSVVGKNTQLRLSKSDEHGNVTYEVRDFYGKHKVVAQTNPETDSTFKIELHDTFADVPTTISTPDFHLSPSAKNPLTQRNLDMQLQRAYEKQNHNTGAVPIDSLPFYGQPTKSYKLDEFTRFPTMEEVMREILKGVMVRKRKGNFHFSSFNLEEKIFLNEDPLVMIDGVPVFNLNDIIAYDPRKIQTIDVILKKYYLGHLTFTGLINCTTYHGNLLDYTPTPATEVDIDGLQIRREFFSPHYEDKAQKESRVPDMRHLLYWAPEVHCDNEGKSQLSFFSSDVAGTYQVVVQGLTKESEFGYTTVRFQVKN